MEEGGVKAEPQWLWGLEAVDLKARFNANFGVKLFLVLASRH